MVEDVSYGMNPLSASIYEAHRQAIASGAGGWVKYKDGDTEIRLRAAWGSTSLFTDTSDQIRTATNNRAFLIRADELKIADGTRVIPKKNARITVEQTGQVFCVLADPGRQVYNTVGPNDELFRVYTKQENPDAVTSISCS